eukprot:CAMPEP_0174830648 /NCGR_PEP_ID=MMETSP1114-20130205/2640_1 /TAXON_ID=312471 /ORGANISM="Neobodo designis, Strain CCAP 1951/1" /LENGTH=59 /DNA_ID=CAMNT_0016064451 /DNA_START=115 /DNA_END=291 /DNA_ORIENTATION=+
MVKEPALTVDASILQLAARRLSLRVRRLVEAVLPVLGLDDLGVVGRLRHGGDVFGVGGG